MHFKRCKLTAFGHFQDVEFDDLSEQIVVLLGPNEAGKSTFFAFLQTMLFGVYPTNPERHRYSPRDGRALEGSAEIVMGDGGAIEVARRLARVPQGHLTNGIETDLRNKAVPSADFISGNVFDAVYALDLHDMTGLEGRAWAEVQDRLLGGMNLDFLRSARKVIEELEREASELWRPDRRGRPLERLLREEREELMTQLAAAQRREGQLADLAAEIESIRDRREALGIEIPKLQSESRRMNRLGPIALRWKKIQALRAEAGDVRAFRHVPDNPTAILAEWRKQDREYLRNLASTEEQIEQSEFDQEAVSESDHNVVRFGDEIRDWSRRLGIHETNLTALRRVAAEGEHVRIGINVRLEDLARPGEEASFVSTLTRFNAEAARDALDQLEEIGGRLAAARRKDEELAMSIDRRRPFVPVAVIAMGALVAGYGVLQSVAPAWMLGAVVGLAGIVWLAYELAQTSALRAERDRLELRGLDADRVEGVAAVASHFGGLPFRSVWLERRDLALLSALSELKELLKQKEGLKNQARALMGMLDADRNAVGRLCQTCGITPDFDVDGSVRRLGRALDEASDRVRRADTARQRLFRLGRDRDRLIADRQALSDQIAQVEGTLKQLGGGDTDNGAEVLGSRRRAALKGDHDESTLDRDHPRWRDQEDELHSLTDADMERFTDDSQQKREDRLDKLRSEERFESQRLARKRNEQTILLREVTPDQIESRIESVDARLREARERRDRLVVLANVIRRADQQFRYKHQPDVIRKASEYLEKITAGRYHRMLLEDDGQRLMIFERGSGIPIEVNESLSQGTRDQIYLSIRFALMDHLDAHQDRLPAFLDEVFVNWDEQRRLLGYEIVKDLARRRQVFVFTCHPWLADELESVVTAQRIEL